MHNPIGIKIRNVQSFQAATTTKHSVNSINVFRIEICYVQRSQTATTREH